MSAPAPAPRVLRVLNGRLAGAERAWPPEARLSIGHQFWQDVVLREPGVRGIAAELSDGSDGQAQLAMLSGEGSLLGSAVQAGAQAILPPYVPLSLGGTAIAWGDPESARWGEAVSLAGAVAGPPALVLRPQDEALAAADRGADAVRRFLSGWRLAAVVGALLLLLGVASFRPLLDGLGLRPSPDVRVTRALADAGLPELHAVPDQSSGGVIVTGIVADQGATARAQQVLDQVGVPGTLDLRTSKDLAAAAADSARLHGLEASARPLGRTGVELHTTPVPPENRDKLLAAVRADVGGLGRLVLVDDLAPDEETTVRTVADVTKKVSTVVAGDPAYIRTADGARYFPGAMMPSGHRLVAIQAQTVVLERNGRQTRITF